MKNGMKLLAAGAAIATAAAGVIAYRKYRDSYELISEEAQAEEEFDEASDFEPIVEVDDDFDYYVEDLEQIMFYE